MSAPPDSVGANLRRLLHLEVELALIEARAFVLRAALAAGAVLGASAALFAALTVLLAAGLATVLPAPWQHLAVAGSAAGLAAGATIVWSIWYLRRLRPPQEVLASLQETGGWLAEELESRLRVPSFVAPPSRRHRGPNGGGPANGARPG